MKGLANKAQRKIQDDPEYFFTEILGDKIWEGERRILNSVKKHRKTTVRTGHGVGKTYTCGRIVPWFMFAFPKSIVITTAPTNRQVKNQLWKEIRTAHKNATKKLGGKMMKTRYEIDEDWFAIGFTVGDGDDASDKFQGWHAENILIIVDEASGVSPDVYDAIEGVMSGGVTVRLLLTGNPLRRTGDFAESWSDSTYNTVHIPSTDSPNVQEGEIVIPGLTTKEWVDDMRKKYGEDSDVYRVRVLGQPPQKESDTLIGIDTIEAAKNKDREKYGETEVIGLDPARFGDDKTAFVYRRGNYSEVMRTIDKQDTMECAGQAMDYLREFPNAVVRIDITGGLGAGVFDRLKEQKYHDRVEGVNVGESATNSDRYYNLRTEGWYQIRDWLEDAILEDHPDWDQLAHPKYEIRSTGQLRLESKKKMKKRGVDSPNIGDALALTFQRATEGGDMSVTWLE